MGYFYALVIEHLEIVLYALTLLAGVVPEALAVLQRRSRGGLSRRRRRRRGGGIFGALGMLLLVFLFGGILILVLGALALFKIIGGRRR